MSTSDKLTYLAGTKDKLKTTINYTGANITNDTFRSYPEKLYNEYIDLVTNGTEILYNNLPKITGSGTNIKLNNTSNGKMSITYNGDTQQDSTTGKNLVDFDNYTSLYNATYDSTTKILTSNALNGDWTGMGINNYNTPTKVEVGTNIYYYSLDVRIKSGTYSSGNLNFFANGDAMANVSRAVEAIQNPTLSSSFQRYIFKITYTNNSGSETQTLNNFIQLKYGANNAVIEAKNFMISTTNSDYEPYTNGASPNPDYPQFIHNVSGDNTIEICGKNLFDKSKVTSGKIVYRETGELGQNNSYSATDYIPIKANVTYTQSNFNYYYSAYYNKNKEYISECGLATFTPSQDGYIRTTVANTNLDIAMIEVGSTASTYEAYTGNSQLISLGVENLFDKDNATQGKGVSTSNGNLYDDSNCFATEYIEITPNQSYAVNSYSSSSNRIYGAYYDSSKTFLGDIAPNANINTFIITNTNAKYIRITGILTNINNYQIEKGSQANSYSEYGKPYIELNKISTYQDYIYKTNDKWYLHKEIGKYKITGSETSAYLYWNSDVNGIRLIVNDVITSIANVFFYCNRFKVVQASSTENNYVRLNRTTDANYTNFWFGNISISGVNDANTFKTWATNNEVILIYPLATPTDTEITDTTLLSQLQTILKSKSGQTNINQENNDLPFILDVSALKEYEL